MGGDSKSASENASIDVGFYCQCHVIVRLSGPLFRKNSKIDSVFTRTRRWEQQRKVYTV